MERKMHYLLVRLDEGRNHPKWKAWWDIVHGQFGGADLDYTGHAAAKIVRTSMDADDFRRYCAPSRGKKSYIDDVHVEEITGSSDADGHDEYRDIVRRFYKVDLDDDE